MKKIYTISFVLASLFSFGQNFTATYDFAGIPAGAQNGLIDPTPPPIVTGLAFGIFTAINSDASQNSSSGRFAYSTQPLGGVNSSDIYINHTGTLDPNTYFTFTITPTAGTVFSLSKITFKVQRSGTGIRTYAVRSSVDEYASNLPASINPINTDLSVQDGNIFYVNADATTAENGSTITLSGTGFTEIIAPITFRIYGWNAETTSGTFSVDDVVVTGSMSTLSVQENKIAGLSIYPNPVTKGILYITSNNSSEKIVTVFDVLGKQILNTKTSNNEVNVANLKSGIYIVKIVEDGKTDTQKIIIE